MVLSQLGKNSFHLLHKSYLLIMLVLSTLIISSCGDNAGFSTTDKTKVIDGKFIINGVDWKEVTQLPSQGTIRKNSFAVGNLSIYKTPGFTTRCTAFLVTPDTIMTNYHCVSNSREAQDATINFTHEAGKGFSQKSSGKFRCDDFIGGSSALDMALLRCEGRPGDQYGVLYLEGSNLSQLGEREKIYVIHQNCNHEQFPSCDPTKKYSPGLIMKKRGEMLSKIVYDADTLTGSSGSPVFLASTNKVIALNNVGLYNVDDKGRMVGNANAGIPMYKIVRYIKENFPQMDLGYKLPRIAKVQY